MSWQKKGLVYCPSKDNTWKHHFVMTPTPILLNSEIIRIYAGFRDSLGVSRIGYIDVKADNPSEVISVSDAPVLDIGRDGAFDDNGIILGDIVKNNNELYMYYVGFQLVNKVKFLAFSGLAISKDGGETFTRYKETPILDRCQNGLYIAAIHSVLYDQGKWKIWYSKGDAWQSINDINYPCYNIWYTESADGIDIQDSNILCIDNNHSDKEYRIGRPRVYKEDDIYKMYCTYDTLDKEYKVAYAESSNGINWERMDSKFPLIPSKDGWDSKMLCYPTFVNYKNKEYMFYSGNNMGESGVGYAERIKE